jgi:predicted RNase H-like nuclease
MVTAVVVGIDVGGEKKGFHAVAFQDRIFGKASSTDPCAMVKWCLDWNASVVAVDAPCGWSQSGSSRLAERELSGRGIHSFATPTCLNAQAHQKGFYGWVFNGLRLYTELGRHHYRLFDGGVREGPICFETFPHAVVCALLGRVVPAKPKKGKTSWGLGGDRVRPRLALQHRFHRCRLVRSDCRKFPSGPH